MPRVSYFSAFIELSKLKSSQIAIIITTAVFSPSKIQGMAGGCGLGGDCDHIKAFLNSLQPHIKERSVLKVFRPTCLRYAGENTSTVQPSKRAIFFIF